eukprot:TRINITY_DN2695_c0_g1_i1.p1 TRINITY_DN2695_c0_g1~~TRINITY_DN2695_c0_g1_i1.p1  ORF type:complete len:172 (-),score=14.63 TRINITY_DN2695_c0_g1_i1:567-1082(-)
MTSYCFLDLGLVIEGMMTTNIVAMFLANSLSLVYHRWQNPDFKRPYEMPLYPLPVIIQVAMFSFIFLTSDNWIISGGNPLLELGIAFLLLGSGLFLLRSKKYNERPFIAKHVEFDNPMMLTRSTTSCSIDTEDSSKKEAESSGESYSLGKNKNKKSSENKMSSSSSVGFYE